MREPTTETGGNAGAFFSVITRTLRSTWLAYALESLARQTRMDFELVLVDKSGGQAESILARFQNRLPAVRRLAIGRPVSRPRALNAGIGAARASHIGILDEDNLYDPAHLERLIEGLAESGEDYVYTGVRHATFSTDGRRIESRDVSIPFQFEKLILGNYIYATGSAFRKSLWERVGGYDKRFEVFEDWDFIIRAAQSGRFHHLPRRLGRVPQVHRYRCASGRSFPCVARRGYSRRMRDASEVKAQISAVRDRLKELSGFWIGEGAAMVYALEWVLQKRETSPAGELGRAGGESEKIAANLTKLVEKAMADKPAPVRAKAAPRQPRAPKTRK